VNDTLSDEGMGVLLEAGPQAAVLVDAEGRVLAVTRSFREFAAIRLGVSIEVGAPVVAGLPAPLADRVTAIVAGAKGGAQVHEASFRDTEGVEHWVEVHAAEVRVGGRIATALTLWPIDARKAAERSLLARDAQLRAAMAAGRLVPWEWEIDADVVHRAIDVPIGGPAPSNLATFLASVHADDRPMVEAALRATLEEGAPYAITYRKVGDGETRWLDARATLVRDEAGRPTKLVGIVADITERKRLEEQLVQSQKMEAMGRLASGVAHEFNNLLTTITSCAQLLAQHVGDPLRQEAMDVLQAAQRGADLTQQLLAFSRRQVLKPTAIDLNAAVREVTSLIRRIVGEDVRLTNELSTPAPQCAGDPVALQQIILSLVVNARDAMPTGGGLVISTSVNTVDGARARELGLAPGRYGVLRVRDTGTGMDAATRARLFEPFFTTKPRGIGTGLALSTCFGIVTQLGGTIIVESAPGAGSTFDVLLPEAVGALRASAPPQARTHGGTETILLVEDEPAVRRITRRVLEMNGYVVLEAEDGEDALVRAGAHDGVIDLLVADVVMPRLGGAQTAARLRELRPEIKVLFVSGYADDAVLRHGVAQGEVSMLRKPYGPDALARAVRAVLDGATTLSP
jgi:signal transduction histidine kinase/ActR/RegA family two-component response regulator